MVVRSDRRSTLGDPGGSPRTPVGINIGVGAVVVVAAALVAAAVPESAPAVRFAVVAVAVGGLAAVTVDQVAVAFVAGLAFLVANGFLVNRLGELSWHGGADIARLGAVVMVSALGLAVGEAYLLLRRFRAWRQWARWLESQGGSQVSMDVNKEESRGG